MMRPTHRVPAVDVREEEDQYVVNAELPGMTKEDVSIEVGDGVLEITAKKEQEREEKGEGYLRRERGAMCFHRRLTLPEDVDPQTIEAKLAEGVLEVRLPKVEKGSARKKVEVQ
jgi:HSP20 family protein